MTKAYRLIGTGDDTDTCEVCGKTELRAVLIVEPIDLDGNSDGDAIYAGSTCGARLLTRTLGRRVTSRRMLDAAAAAERVIATARKWGAEFAPLTRNQFLAANANGLLNLTGGDTAAALELGARRWAETIAEAERLISATSGGDLIGTRFESKLPRL